jgi:NTP pyrophosphatase (non-canonical NTP hydrolase)
MTAGEKEREILEMMDLCKSRISDALEKSSGLKEYQELCKLTAKKFETPEKEILTWGLGIAGEAGDVASCIKKTFAHDNDQRLGIRENIGDTLWYAAMICNFFNWDMQEILNENTEKLQKRFPNGFTIDNARRDGAMIDWNEQ